MPRYIYRKRSRRKRRKKIIYYSPESHKLRSKGEWIIETWLHKNKVKHIYEPRSKEYGKYIPDWLTQGRHVIEFFGYYGARKDYDKRTREKIKYFKRKFSSKFIPLFQSDLVDLDNKLKAVLK
jgi:hypothetical protein